MKTLTESAVVLTIAVLRTTSPITFDTPTEAATCATNLTAGIEITMKNIS
jgi:hypothetical protein